MNTMTIFKFTINFVVWVGCIAICVLSVALLLYILWWLIGLFIDSE